MTDPSLTERDRSQRELAVLFPDRKRLEPSLPVPLTSFIGRQREVAAVVATLVRPDVRLLTVTGR